MTGELPRTNIEAYSGPIDPSAVKEAAISLGVQFPEVFKDLKEEYTGKVLSRYVDMSEAVAELIENGKLPETYLMPDLEVFTERIVALSPSYEAFGTRGWEPDVVFVPEGLSFDDWNVLLSGHELKKNGKILDEKSEGIRFMSDGALSIKNLPKAKVEGDNLWDIAVISGAEQPVMMSVSASGKSGSKAEAHIALLSGLPTAIGASPELVRQFSPDHDVYFALQLTSLMESHGPVDPNETETWTIAAENIEVEGGKQTLYYYWREPLRQICIDYTGMDYARNALGVRPTVRGKELTSLG